MKLLLILVGCLLFSATSLHIREPHDQHEGFIQAWNDFWGSFGKGNPTSTDTSASSPPANTVQPSSQGQNQYQSPFSIPPATLPNQVYNQYPAFAPNPYVITPVTQTNDQNSTSQLPTQPQPLLLSVQTDNQTTDSQFNQSSLPIDTLFLNQLQ